MAGTHASAPKGRVRASSSEPAWPSTIRTMMTVFGAICGVLGVVMLIPADEQYIGIGSWTWKTSDLSNWWGIGFVVGGVVLMLAALVWRQRKR